MADATKWVVFGGGRQSGKRAEMLRRAFEFAQANPHKKVAIVRSDLEIATLVYEPPDYVFPSPAAALPVPESEDSGA